MRNGSTYSFPACVMLFPKPHLWQFPEAALSSDREAFHKTWSAPLAKRFVDVGREAKNSSPALKKFQLAQPFTGCNWPVPILERSFIDANLWVQTTTLDENQQPHMYQFRTHPKRVQKNLQIIIFIGKRKHIKALKPAEYGNDREFIECLEVGAGSRTRACLRSAYSSLTMAGVRKYDLDFFNQRIVLSDAPTTNRNLPRLRTLDETSDLIETTFGHDVHIGYLPGPELMWDPTAEATEKDLRSLSIKEGKPLVQCKFSAALRRYCTFTANIDDLQDLYRDLTYHMRRHPFPLHVIPEPAKILSFLGPRGLGLKPFNSHPNSITRFKPHHRRPTEPLCSKRIIHVTPTDSTGKCALQSG
ncbi:hypothetical protein FAGAP_12332 [Fusarium agapanthi]|uniref:Uncharacterized protein n=1 Tax=Fusarium agapanthi TaxID=1803897 RepID=A0A9P5AZV7_9HYPO|nr:hypothetical protein FAGAP_12332 [Fusarium agapanthi]